VVDHPFPSDGEYVLTITPIFGDNMSPTGFGSVPCEKIEVILDGERLQLLDWQGGGRGGGGNCGNAGGGNRGGRAGNAGGRGAAPAGGTAPAAAATPAAAGTAAAQDGARTGGQGAAAGRQGGGGGGQRGPGGGMRVRFTTTAGVHSIGATFLATNFAPVLDLDRHFMRSTVQTGPTPGYTFFPHIGTIRIEGPYNAKAPTDSPSRRRIFICTPATAAQETPCARQILTNLATRAFRKPATAADVNLLMSFYETGRKAGGFEGGIENALARILASPQFVYRIVEEPASVRNGQAFRLSDLALASRLSFFLWSTSPDEELLAVAKAGRLKDPTVLEQQVRRMLRHPKAEALAVNFAGQWLNLRGLDSSGPLPLIYPDFDDPLRQAMRREVELIFDTIVREDRSIVDLLNADYTFVNERLAKHYGIKNVYGSNFRRVTLPAALDNRRGLLGKGAFLVTTSKPERTSPVTRGKWIMSNIMGMSPPDPPPDVPPLPPRSADAAGNVKEPTMREKMATHSKSTGCAQCHQLMDPIGFALESFDGIGVFRTLDEGQEIDVAAQTFDNTKIAGPAGVRNWLVDGYSNLFVLVTSEKLLTYALGRGLEHRDMPLVRAIARDATKNGNRFSALVLGVVKSQPFQMNAKSTAAPDVKVAGLIRSSDSPDTHGKGNH
jgi:hypothetical protein